MALTSESYFAKKDPIFGEPLRGVVTGAVSAEERSERIAAGWSLGEVTRGKREASLESHAVPTDAMASREVAVSRSTVMRNIITDERRTLAEVQDASKARLVAEHAGTAAVSEAVAEPINFEDARDALVLSGFNIATEPHQGETDAA